MKKTYITPCINICKLSTEKDYCESFLADSGRQTNGFGTSTSSGIKDEFSGDIEFNDMTGTDMVKRNPWDSQW